MVSQLQALKLATSLKDVALLLGFKPKSLAYILYGKTDAEKYSQFQIPKKTGGVRTINAPAPDLRTLQRRLSDFLQNCIHEINESRNIKSALSHGFRRGYSIVTNASTHRRKRYVFNTDLEDFFAAINLGRVRGYFIKNKNFELNPSVATVLAQIACHDNALPQGSPCSPVISNLIGHILDIRLARLAYDNSCIYSRYADDLTFSTNENTFPISIARRIEGEEHRWEVGEGLEFIIKAADFSINTSKTRMQYRDSRQDVTGLVVNSKVNTRAEYWRTARAMVHRLLSTGSFQFKQSMRDESGNIVTTEIDGTIEQLNGILSFIDSIDYYNDRLEEINDKEKAKRKNNPHNSRQEIYKRFLFYKNFYNPPKPLIICEGKTDNVYLKAAIYSLHENFPELVEKDSDGKFKMKVSFFRYSKTAARISYLGGGTGDIPRLISHFPYQYNRIKAPGGKQPVIILSDNDKGATPILKAVSDKVKDTVDGSKPFYHISDNLYFFAIPKLEEKNTTIEDYFPTEWLQHEINGKKFNPHLEHHGSETEYSKQVFAEQVVKKNQDKIDFGRFQPILERIRDVIGDHNEKQSHPVE